MQQNRFNRFLLQFIAKLEHLPLRESLARFIEDLCVICVREQVLK